MQALFASFGAARVFCLPSSLMSLPLEQLSSYLLYCMLRLFNVPTLVLGLDLYFTLSLDQFP